MQISEKQNILTRTWVVAALACVCCILWGSAIPVIKTGYRILAVDSADTASQIVFAGIRFALAGILVLLFASIREKRVVLPDGKIFKYVIPVCFAQTFVQYFFFYIGVAHTSGVKGGIITGLGNFIAILMACLLVRNEKMTGRKLAGCILGFAGVVIINMAGGSMDMGFRLTGEGFDRAAFLWSVNRTDQYFLQKSITGYFKRLSVLHGRCVAVHSRNPDGRTLGSYVDCRSSIDSLPGNGIGCGVYTLVGSAGA